MDSRPDEIERQITMKSSGVRISKSIGGAQYELNIIDTPGHIDFSYEVNMAIGMTQGSFLLVDIAEGVMSQTYYVLKRAVESNHNLILILNKMDKLMNSQLKVQEIYEHL